VVPLGCGAPDRHTAGVRSDPGFTRSRGGRHDRELEEAESAPIGLESSIVDSMGHGLSRKTFSYDARPIVLRLRTISRGKSSARAGHLTASRLAFTSPLSLSFALSPSPGWALIRHVTVHRTQQSRGDQPHTTAAAIKPRRQRARLDKNAPGRRLRSTPVPVWASDDPARDHADAESSRDP
jgi:hypothetical protein